MVLLNTEALSSLPDQVARPNYQRDAVGVGIVHFGVGGFHRAHQAMYLDRLMNEGQALSWGICGIGVMPSDRAMAEALTAQDGLYTLVIKHPDGHLEPRVIGSLVEVRFAPDDPRAVLDLLCSEQVRIVSLTITEGGYNFNQVTHEFEADNPAIVADAATGAVPATVFGYVVRALAERRRNGVEPFTVMSCDNIQSNGDMARQTFTAFARLVDPELADWMAGNVRFPNSMVDRITPVTTPADRAELAEQFGVEDNWPVVCEPFTQWVLEDDFTAGRPPLEQAGVQVVPAVEPYELMKLRLLNASHQALGYFGYLAGYRYVHEVASDPRFVRFVRSYMDNEATPTLLPVPGVDIEQYKQQLIERFANPGIRDTVRRLCAESSDRIPKWVLPVLRHNLDSGAPISHASAIVASWARYAEGVDEQGEPIEIVDRLASQVSTQAKLYDTDPLAFLQITEVFGDLAGNSRFRKTYEAILIRLHEIGTVALLDELEQGLVG
jgi:mannitol 2-dehydrogenase